MYIIKIIRSSGLTTELEIETEGFQKIPIPWAKQVNKGLEPESKMHKTRGKFIRKIEITVSGDISEDKPRRKVRHFYKTAAIG